MFIRTMASHPLRWLVAQVLIGILVAGLLPAPPVSADPGGAQPASSGAESAPDFQLVQRHLALDMTPSSSREVGIERLGPEQQDKLLGASEGTPEPTAEPVLERAPDTILRPHGAPPPQQFVQRQVSPGQARARRSVQPPASPTDLVQHFPNEYRSAQAPSAPAPARLSAPGLLVHPRELRFRSTADGVLPRLQNLSVRSGGELAPEVRLRSVPEWLSLERHADDAVDVVTFDAVVGETAGGPLRGEIVIESLDRPQAIERVEVVVEAGGAGDLESRTPDGEIERRVRPDGRVIDYQRGHDGRLLRILHDGEPFVELAYDAMGRRTRMTDRSGTTVYRWNGEGRLDAVHLTAIGPIRYRWDGGQLAGITYPDGRAVSYGYDPAGRLATVFDGTGETSYGYDEQGRLVERALPNGVTTTYLYDPLFGRVSAVEHRSPGGEVVLGFTYQLDSTTDRIAAVHRESTAGIESSTFTYDSAGRLGLAHEPDGRSVSYEYDRYGRRSRHTVVDGDRVTVVDYLYDRRGRLTRAGEQALRYDTNGNLAERSSPAGRTLYRYDAEDRLVAVVGEGAEMRYEYDGNGRLAAIRRGDEVVRLGYDDSGFIARPLVEAAADGTVLRSWVHGLDRLGGGDLEAAAFLLHEQPLGQPAAAAGPEGDLSGEVVYDAFGRPELRGASALLPAALDFDPVTRLIYREGRFLDPELGLYFTGDPESSAGAAGSGTSRRGVFGDQLVRAVGGAEPLAGSPVTEEPAAPPAEGAGPATQPDQEIVTFQSNALPPETAGAAATPLSLPFPKLTQLLREETPRSSARAARLGAGGPHLRVHPEGLVFAVAGGMTLPASQPLRITGVGGTASFSLAADEPWILLGATSGSSGGTPVEVEISIDRAALPAASRAEGTITLTNDGDPDDRKVVGLTVLLDEELGLNDLLSFDGYGRLLRAVRPDGSVVDVEHGPAGDPPGRLVLPDGPDVLFSYDPQGRRTEMVDARGETVYQHDFKGRLTAIYHPGLNPIHYQYDNADRIETVTYPDGSEVVHSHDADGRIVGVTSPLGSFTFGYDPLSGRLTEEHLPNGVRVTYSYHPVGTLAEVAAEDASGTILERHSYDYDAIGLITSYTRLQAGVTRTFTYAYDDIFRLVRVDASDGASWEYSYDPLGNVTSRTVTTSGGSAETATFEYEGNLLVRAGEEMIQHDLLGRIVRRVRDGVETVYSWDSRDRLLSVARDGETLVEYGYDGDGRRVSRTTPGEGTTHFVNDPLGRPLIEANSFFQVTRRHTYADRRLGINQGGQSYFFLSSGPRGDVSGVTNGGGGIAESLTYDPFGRPAESGPPALSPYGYAGAHREPATGLIYFNQRYYDPELGRFLTPDPFAGLRADPQTYNPYAYARNNPVNTVDDSGEFWNFLIGAGLGVAGQYVTDVAVNLAQGNGLSSFTSGLSSWQSYASAAAVGAVNPGAALSGTLFKAGASTTARTIGKGAFEGATNSAIGNLGTQGLEFATGDRSSFSGGSLFADTLTGGLSGGVGSYLFRGDSFKAEVGRTAVDSFFDAGSELLGDAWSTPSSSSSAVLRGGVQYNDYSSWWGSSAGGDLGGVDLNKTADLLLEIDDLAGAAYDEKTGQLVLFGTEDVSLPEMDLDDMAVAVDAVFSGEDPGVSIDPPIVNNQMAVRYVGPTAETEFGWIMYEADRVLKILSLGKDNVTGQPVGSNVPGYQNMLERRLAAGCNNVPDSTRMFFQPKEIRLVRSADGQTMLFDEVSMELLWESKIGNQVVNDPQAAAFANHFTDNYDLFAAEWPILQELERLGKIVGVIKWLKDSGLPIDVSFIENFGIELFPTPTSTPAVTVQGTQTNGPVTCTITMQGGVTYRPPNEYIEDDPIDPVTDAVRQVVLESRPDENEFSWTFTPPQELVGRSNPLAGGEPASAVAQSFTRSRKDGNTRLVRVDLDEPVAGDLRLGLTRWYDSFGDRSGPFGPGWRVLPFELRFPVDRETFTFGPSNISYDLYRRIWVAERPRGAEESFELIGIDDNDLPLYLRSGAMDLLRQKADGTYEIRRQRGGGQLLAEDGRLLEVLDAGGRRILYDYDALNRLSTIGAEDGRTILLTYSGDRVVQAAGPGGRQVSYGYSPSGLLVTVSSGAQFTETYAYSDDERLESIVDAEGHVVYEAGYDDYQRTPSRRLGGADFTVDFELDQRRTVITDTDGRASEQLHDEEYRPLVRIDPLGNRSAITYDGDFGPASITDLQGDGTQLVYDVRGNLTEVADDDGDRIELFYDFRDLLVATRDAAGVETAFGYDDDRNLTQIYHSVLLEQDPSGTLTGFLYDPNDVTDLDYDANGELIEADDPLGGATLFDRSSLGLIEGITSPGGLFTGFGYDGRSRLATVATAEGPIALAYDDDDNLTSIENPAGRLELEYDGNGRLTAVTAADPATDFTSVGSRFAYDAAGNLTQVLDGADLPTAYAYDASGRLLQADLPNGTRNRYAYDALGRPVSSIRGLEDARPRLGLSTHALSFGRVPVGQQASRELILYNLSRTALTVSSVTADAPFGVGSGAPTSVAAGEVAVLEVLFTPTAAGGASATLTVVSDDAVQPVQQVALDGDGARLVTGLDATAVGETIALTWDPFDPGSQPFGHFAIYRSTDPIPGSVEGLSPLDTSLTDPAATSFTDDSAEPGVRYYYAVTAVFADGFEDPEVDPAGPVAFFTGFGPLEPPFDVAGSPGDETRPAVAYSTVSGVYLAVFELDDGSGTTDVYGQRLAADGMPLGAPFAIAAGPDALRRPRLAYNAGADEFLVVFEFDFEGDGSNWVVAGQRVAASGLAVGAAFFVGGFVVHENDPDVVFNPTANEYFVIFDLDINGDGSDISVVGQRVTATGNLAGPAFLINQVTVGGVSVHDRHGRLATHPVRNEYLVASEIDVEGDGSDWDLIMARFSASSTSMLSFNSFGLQIGGVPRDDLDPFLAFDSVHGEYLVTWQAEEGPASDVFAQKLDELGEFTGLSGGLFSMASSGQPERRSSAVYNPVADEFVIVWDTAEIAVEARRFQVTESSLFLGGTFTVADGGSPLRRADTAWNGDGLELLVVWEEDRSAGGTGFDVRARRLGSQAPLLEITPASLDFGGAATELTLEITNGGSGTLDWLLVSAEPWLGFAPGSGQVEEGAVEVSVTVDRTGLAAGSYQGTLLCSSNGGDLEVPVTMTVPGAPPDPPSMPVPADGADGVLAVNGTPDVVLSWQGTDPDDDPLVYDVYFSSDPSPVENLDPAVQVASGQSAASFATTGLSYQTSYWWRVVADDGSGTTAGPVWSFTTGAVGAPVVQPVSPDPTNDPRPALTWSAATGAVSYRVQVATDPGFPAPLIDATTAMTSFVPAADLPEIRLYWRVASLDDGGVQGPFSGVDDFTVDLTPPEAPVPIPVSPDPTSDARPTLAWSSVADAASYRLEVDDDAAFAPPRLIETTVGGTSFSPTTDLPEGTIHWRVASRDAAANTSGFAVESFTIDRTAPPPVTGLTTARTPNGGELSWDPAAGPPADFDHYSVYRSAEGFTSVSGMTPLTEALTDPASTLYLDATAQPGIEYHYAVTAVDEVGNENQAVTSVILPANLPPDAPTAPAPEDGATEQPAPEIVLGWQATDPDSPTLTYDVYLSTVEADVTSLNVNVRVAEGVETEAFTATGLQFGTTYYWRVVAFDDHEASTPGDVWSFVTLDLQVPVLVPVSPDPTDDPSPTLSWQAVSGVSEFRLQVAPDPDFTSPLYDETVADTSWSPPSPLADGDVYWRVASRDAAGGESAFSAPDHFVVDTVPPQAPVPNPMAPDPTNDPRPTLTWTSVADAVEYRLQVSVDPVFGSTLFDVVQAGTAFTPPLDLPEGAVHWRVAALDAAGNESAFSAVSDFTVDVTTPDPPVLIPVSPDPTMDPRPTLTWNAVADAADYRLQVATTPDFATTLYDVVVAATDWVPPADLPEGTVYWRAASRDDAGNESSFPTADSFSVDLTAPAVPVLTSVSPDPTMEPRPTLGWNAVADAAEYRLQVATTPDFATTLYDIVVTTTSWVPPADLPEGPVHWRVASRDEAGNQSAFSTADSFTVDLTAPAVPVLIPVNPDPTMEPRPTLGWNAVADATDYRLQVATTPDFATTLYDVVLATTSWVPPADLPEGPIHWRVASRDAAGNASVFSAADLFVVDLTAPQVPVLIPVSPDPTGQPRPTLAWEEVADAQEYRVQVATEPAFSSPLHDVDVSATSWVPVADLPEGEIYWRVASRDLAGNESPFSPADVFVVDLTMIFADGFESGDTSAWSQTAPELGGEDQGSLQ